VLQLKAQMGRLDEYFKSGNLERIPNQRLDTFYHLGDIQVQYQTFVQNYAQMNASFGEGYYYKRKELLLADIQELKKTNEHLNDQLKLYARDADLSEKEYSINEKLLNEKVIARLDIYREESKLIGKKIPAKNIQSSIHSNNGLISSKQREIIELETSSLQQKESFIQAFNLLRSAIDKWENQYLLSAPVDGVVKLATPTQEKQHFRVGTEVMYISPENKSYVGDVRIPQINFGKVRTGQKVLIKLQGYPFEEFGALNGTIKSIAELPSKDDQFFWATVNLPAGFVTDAGKKVNFTTGMKASAEIITENLRLMERLFYNFKRTMQER
jgi:multidrug resistance efflux pump